MLRQKKIRPDEKKTLAKNSSTKNYPIVMHFPVKNYPEQNPRENHPNVKQIGNFVLPWKKGEHFLVVGQSPDS
jgi:hypothetical protein